jgi:hypothetical protein
MTTAFLNGDVCQVTVYCRCQEQGGLNVRHFKVRSGGSLGLTDADFAAYVSNAIKNDYKGYLAAAATYVGVGVQLLTPVIQPTPAYSTLGTGTGSGGGDPLPKQVAGITTLLTAYRGRKYRGRMYFPFAPEDSNDANDQPDGFTTGFWDNIGAFFTSAHVVTVGASTLTLDGVLYHRADGSTTTLTGYRTRGRWATQRRRGDFGKTNVLPI